MRILRVAGVLRNIEDQTTRPDEVFFIDGSSDDGTREWLEDASGDRSWMHVVDNPAKIIPVGLNLGVAQSRSDLVARMDAHVDYPPNYLEVLVNFLTSTPGAVGVGAPYEVKGESAWGRATASVLRRPWGHGGATHQTGAKARPTNHVRWPLYRRDIVLATGGWDETMLVNEDEEMDFRVRSHGSIWLVPGAKSVWYVRSSPRGLVRQMWRYGFYRAVTVRHHPRSANVRTSMPGMFVAVLTVLLILKPRRGLQLALTYLGVGAGLGIASAVSDDAPWALASGVLPLVHLPYGAGFITGLILGERHRPEVAINPGPSVMSDSDIRVSAILVSYNSKEDLLRNLPPLLEATSRDTDEVILVDNNSSDLTAEIVSRLFPEVRVIEAGSNLGFGGAVNLAAAQARGRTLLILNPDVRMRSQDIDALVARVDRTGGVAGPVLCEPSSGKRLYGSRYDLMGLPIESSRPRPAFYVQGCALAISSALFRRIGGFDDRYFLFAEDADLCWRAGTSGAPVDIVINAEAVHSGGGSEPGGYVKDGADVSQIIGLACASEILSRCSLRTRRCSCSLFTSHCTC